MARIRWPWTRELDAAKQSVTEAIEHREAADRKAENLAPLSRSVIERKDLNGFSRKYVIVKQKEPRHA